MAVPEYTGTVPNRRQPSDQFNDNTASFLQYVGTLAPAINTTAQEVNDTAGSVESNATAAADSATLSEEWATQTGSTVDGTEYSAKEHASGTTVPAGSAKEWATSTTEVASGLKGARGYAQDASASASSAATDATRAESAVATLPAGTIADAIVAPDKAWSSQKINSLLTLDDQLSFKSDFVRDEHFVDDGTRTFAPAEYVWEVQRASPTYALTANGKYREVPVNTIARDWNPETGQYEAQISGAVTNELLWSNQFDDAVWVIDAGSVSASSDSVIEGESAYDFTENTSLSVHGLAQLKSVTSGTRYTFSTVIEKNSSDFIQMVLSGSSFGGNQRCTFDLQALTFSNNDVNADIHDIGGGFVRMAIGLQAVSSGSASFFALKAITSESSLSAVNYTGDGVSGFSIAHSQLVEGTQPGPIVVTEDAPVTRAATIPTAEGDQFNQYQGTLEIVAKVPTGETVATFGSITIVSDSDDMKTYTETYTTDIGTPTLTLGNGVFASVKYMPEVEE